VNSLTIGLVGNPNCGKTTVFNALTGGQQRVGNWPGVTVERKSGFFIFQGSTVEVIDLPGIYSLASVSTDFSIDEGIACDAILQRQMKGILNILDASNLERSLYLTVQLLEMGAPVILVLNMMDVARQRHIKIAVDQFTKEFNCNVVTLEANKNKGIKELKKTIVECQKQSLTIPHSPLSESKIVVPYPALLADIVTDIAYQIPKQPGLDNKWLALRLLEEDLSVHPFISRALLEKIPLYQQKIHDELNEDSDILLAEARYRFIQEAISRCVTVSTAKHRTWTTTIDSIVLHRLFGIPIFLGVMYLMFLFAINIGGAFQDFFDIGSHTFFVAGVAHGLAQLNVPAWIIALLANGVGKGISTTVTFIPVMGAMFLFLAFLEDSGYMARAAFVIDRLMRALGLPGKSFVPMIVGFGCNVPAVMAARTLDNKRDRILTVMMSPFMSCGARLAIYAVFTAAFFPAGGQNIIFILYLIGIMLAMLTGLLLRKTLLQGESAPLIMELPTYHLPNLKTLGLQAWQRLKSFVFRAGKLIVPICILLGMLGSLKVGGSLSVGEGDAHSLLSVMGRFVTPLFAPMGIQQDNWPATVGLLTGVLAKEVVIGTLNALYSQMGHLAALSGDVFNFWGGLHDALMSIPLNLSQLSSALGNPILAQAPVHTVSQGVYGMMVEKFNGQKGAIAYLLFVLLYFPCVSTTAAMLREVNRGWALFSVIWTTSVAYGVAVAFYQLATWKHHPIVSLSWVMGIVIVFICVILAMRFYSTLAAKKRGQYEFA
jgi:ferrous iron transport protein B